MIGPRYRGWIYPEKRTDEQKRLAAEFDERVGFFGAVGKAAADIPDRIIFAEFEVKHLGEVLPRIFQQSGSCVGSAGAVAYVKAMLGDVIARGDNEEVKMPFPFATYGVGRRKAGMRRKGEGSFGAAQAWACEPDNFGYLPHDFQGLPGPVSIDPNGNWWKYDRRVEMAWSHPSAWPIQERQLAPDAGKYGIHAVTRVRSIDDLVQGLAQLYSVTLASMFACDPRVDGDVSIGRKRGQWAHQMGCSGFWEHPKHGLIFLIDNQWSAAAHPQCPTLKEFGSNGSFWIYEGDMDWIIRTGEVFLHSSTGGFPGRKIDHGWRFA